MPTSSSAPASPALSLSASADLRRREAAKDLLPSLKASLGQFMTPASTAEFMASLFPLPDSTSLRILDAGAGVGSLTAAMVQRICNDPGRAQEVVVNCYEIDPALRAHLEATLEECRLEAVSAGLMFQSNVRECDFIVDAANGISPGMFSPRGGTESYTHAILNPPYKKIQTGSLHRRLLSSAGIETSNLYTAFVALAIKLLSPGGFLVAITPRSFCNGPYFLPFRRLLLSEMSILRIHTFEARDQAFRDDDVLQENVIVLAGKAPQSESVLLSSSRGPHFQSLTMRLTPMTEVVHSDDPQSILHIPTTEDDSRIARQLRAFRCTLDDLSIRVSTGPVVDFRLRSYIHELPSSDTVPLLYPAHFRSGVVQWPHPTRRKPSAIDLNAATLKWLMPKGYYTVARRFSSKEERRRVVAAVFDPSLAPGNMVGFENHLNVFHAGGHGLHPEIARGLCIYLNSTLVDRFFRQFNGHTQVNASDLRNLRYPDVDLLKQMGNVWQDGTLPSQESIDEAVNSAFVAYQSR